MSESSNEQGAGSGDDPDVGLIPDEQLPDDLQPDKNPLAADPDDESGSGEGSGEGSGDGAPKVDGMPDMGQPG